MFLNCHSWYSFHYGTLSVPALLEQARESGIRKMVLSDINNTSGILDFIRLAPRYGIEPVAGIEFRQGDQLRYIGIAANNEGFEELNLFLSECLRQGALHGASSGNRDALIPLQAPDFRNAWIIYPAFGSEGPPCHESAQKGKRKPKVQFPDHVFFGLRPADLSRLPFSHWNEYRHRCVVLHPVTLSSPKQGFSLHRLLSAVGHNALLSQSPTEALCQPDEVFCSEAELRKRYERFPEILHNTDYILRNSHIAFDFGENKNKKLFSGSRHTDAMLLEGEAWKGLQYRYGANPSEAVKARLTHELNMISELGFSSYFLINWDIVRYARRQGYFYVGRGSGANSLVAYCLRITDVDPVDLDLYFERFINPYRQSPPDFDLDFSWKDRDDLTAYIFSRHGERHTALLATYSTYQSQAALRELGKVFGLPAGEIESLQDLPRQIKRGAAGEAINDKLARTIYRYAQLMQDFPHHLSIHAGGILISEKPIASYTALNHPPKGFPLTQFSMLEAEDIGLYKYDILSQRGLGHIRDTVDLVERNRGEQIDIHRVAEFKEDPAIKTLLREGRCMGCFYVESPAMRMLLSKLKADTYIQLVAASSIIRPGVARSGMMREYILRNHDPSRRTYIHPVMKTLMEETYGIMVYQEDVIKVAHHFAGLGLSESDVLRRGMSGKFRSRDEFQKIRDRFFANCHDKGYAEEITTEVWRQIESFAGYSFSKGHSASYAVESYQSLYLKAHYPLEFMVGVINNFGGFYNTEFYVHEARMQGAGVHAPDINRSGLMTDIRGRDIYLGFIHIADLSRGSVEQILYARKQGGDYRSLADFMSRVAIEREQLRILIRCGAFRFTGSGKKQLLWEMHLHLGDNHRSEPAAVLFGEPSPDWRLPVLSHHPFEDALDEIELLGFPLCSPFQLLREPPSRSPIPRLLARDLSGSIGRQVELIGYLVTTKPTRTVKGEYMAFGTWIDEKGDFFDSTHFPKVILHHPFRGRGLYRIQGKVDEEFGFCSLTVRTMEKLAVLGRDDISRLKDIPEPGIV